MVFKSIENLGGHHFSELYIAETCRQQQYQWKDGKLFSPLFVNEGQLEINLIGLIETIENSAAHVVTVTMKAKMIHDWKDP